MNKAKRLKCNTIYQLHPASPRENIMEIFVRNFILFIITFAVVLHKASTQGHFSQGGQEYRQTQTTWEECGIQDKDELPDMHAAAPWAAALFYVEGDIFQNNLKQQYLNTAIFITKNLAITSGSKIVAQQESLSQTKLQLYYGHRASGKQTLIGVRKVESLNLPKQPLALKVDTASSTSTRTLTSQQTARSSSKTSSADHADLYLLHLESSIDITSFSRPLCLKKDIFPYKTSYYNSAGRSSNKVHISGYAAKNETSGPHVVYFTGDREWRVQNWDTDYITVMMRDQQVSYGFLPKHFNPGSAFSVKIENNFYLAGILLRSSGLQTTIHSLEKYIDMIMAKGIESHPPQPQPQQPNQSNYGKQEHLSSPVYSNIRPGASAVPPSQINPNYENSASGQQHAQYYPPRPNLSPYDSHPAPAGQQQQSSTNTQNAYLQEVEASEFGQDVSHGQSGSRQDNNRRNTGTIQTTSKYNTVYPATSTYRPSLSNQQQIYNPNPNQPQINFGSTISSTTPRSHRQSQVPQYVFHPDSQRPVPTPFRPEHQQQQQNNYHTQAPATRCSHDNLEVPSSTLMGVDIECLSRQRGVSTTDCIRNAPAGTKIRLSCKQHYVPLDGDKLIEKTCDTSGNWLPRKAFACKLDCGNVDRSVPYIVHGSKTDSSRWPWHTALFKRINETSYRYICGATLITRSILVTAAHCVYNNAEKTISPDPNEFKVVVGAISSKLLSNRKDPEAQEFAIKRIKVNQHYNSGTFESDIALLQLEKSVVLTENVRPVCFPFPSDESKQVSSYQLSEGNSGVVVGFGTTEDWKISSTLRMATLPVVSVKDCTNVLERLPSSSQYCAGYTNGTSVCEGDSGGGHVFKDQISKRFFIQGIISHGNRKESGPVNSRCDHEKYTVFTKVGSFAEWVKEAVYDLEYDYNRRRRRK